MSKPANPSDAVSDAFDAAIAAIPTCALDEEGTVAQRARYAQLACDVKRLERTGDAVVIEFHDRFDRETLEETLAVERACCPFFLFRFDEEFTFTSTPPPPGPTTPAGRTTCPTR